MQQTVKMHVHHTEVILAFSWLLVLFSMLIFGDFVAVNFDTFADWVHPSFLFLSHENTPHPLH